MRRGERLFFAEKRPKLQIFICKCEFIKKKVLTLHRILHRVSCGVSRRGDREDIMVENLNF